MRKKAIEILRKWADLFKLAFLMYGMVFRKYKVIQIRRGDANGH